MMGSKSVFLSGEGYFHEQFNILINKSCSGFNFWLLSFLAFIYLIIKYLDKPLQKILSIPAVLLCTYLVTILVNSFRIFASVIVQNQTKFFLPNLQHLFHEAVGIITYLTFLVLTYYLFEKLLIHKLHHAQPA